MKGVSDIGAPAFLLTAAALPFLRDGHLGKDHALRAVDSIGVALAATELLKAVVKENRPDGSGRDSFPSGHATLAFAAATMESAFHPKEAPLWFAGAALIGWSRVSLRKHQLHGVLAGALIGFGTGRLELSQVHGIGLTPWIGRDSHSGGLSFGRRF